MSGLFRQAALEKISNPDQLDRVLQVVRPVHGIGIVAIALLIAGGLAWSIFSSAPVKVRGQGILLSAQGVAVVSSPSEGRIESIMIQPGDPIEKGQLAALLRRPANLDAITSKRAELEGARKLLDLRQASHARHQRLQNELLETKRQTLAEQLSKLQQQRDVLLERRNDNDADLADLESRIAGTRNDGVELMIRQLAEEAQKNQEIQEAGIRIQALEHELGNMERDYERNRSLTAPVAGTVVELSVNPGDLVSTGQTVMRLLTASAQDRDHSLHAIIFVPNEDGKKIKEGMNAQIMPSTTTLQKDGFIHGKVLSVAKIPSSREGIMRRLKNTTLVDSALRTGAPFEVELELEADPASHSGYKWSSGKGPDISIDAGTIARADMVVERRRVISLALPFFDHVFRWLGAH